MDEEYCAFGLARGWKAFNVMDTDLGVGLLKPDLLMAG